MPTYRGCAVILLACMLGSSGCASWQKRRQLEAVARDWCYTIRASQVLPVYPLSEDVQPGDLYLVQLPIDRQQEAYRDSGFLPLDNLLARLEPNGYTAFYRDSFAIATGDVPKALVEGDGAGWARAPTAAFPSYAFSVKSGQGAKVAIPVNGVPVGLSLMNSDAANGSITIGDVRTYGVDTTSLFDDVTRWAREHSAFLAYFAPHDEKAFWVFSRKRTNYLRVVSRVYATRKVNVQLRDSSASSGQGDVGVPKTVDLLMARTDDNPDAASAQNYAANVEKLNSALGEALQKADTVAPGGTLKLVAASSRSVSLVEVFPKPLVIGYLGFDMAILEKGAIGPPIPTYAVLAEGARASEQPVGVYEESPSTTCIEAWLAAGGNRGEQKSRVKKLNDWWSSRNLPGFGTALITTKEFQQERAEFIAEMGISCEEPPSPGGP